MIVIIGDTDMRAIVNGYATFTPQEQADVSAQLNGFRCGIIGAAVSFSEPFWTRTDQGVIFSSANMQQLFRMIVGDGNDVIRPGDAREFIFSMGSQPSLLHARGLSYGHTAGWHIDDINHRRAGFRTAMLHYNRYVFGFFKTLTTLGVKFSVMAGPPPSLQFALLRQKGARGLDLWRFHEEIFSQELDVLGVPMEQPPVTVRENNAIDGYLRLSLCDSLVANSPNGNKAYGDLFLRSMLIQRGVVLKTDNDGDRFDSPEVVRDWYCNLGFSLANKREIAAKAEFERALEIDPDHKESMFGLGYAYERLGRAAEAERQFKDTLTKHPEYADCWAALGALKIASKEMDEAKLAMTIAIELDPSRIDRRLRLGAILEKLDKDEARRVLREALFDGGVDDAENVEPVLKDDPLELSQPKSSIPVEPDPYVAATTQVRSLAPFLIVLGRLEMEDHPRFAERCFKSALANDDRPEWRSYLGDIYFARGEWTLAAANYQPALEKFPTNTRFADRLRTSREKLQEDIY